MNLDQNRHPPHPKVLILPQAAALSTLLRSPIGRRELRARRKTAAAAEPDAAQKLLIQFQKINLPGESIVAGYAPVNSEMDPAPILEFLTARNVPLCLPVMMAENTPLEFHLYKIGDELNTDNPHKIFHPTLHRPVTPHILLVPLLGFDRAGNRIGYGKGYYDRTLRSLRARGEITAIGLAYSEQEVEKIVAAPHDQPLNIIVTPREVIYCSAS